MVNNSKQTEHSANSIILDQNLKTKTKAKVGATVSANTSAITSLPIRISQTEQMCDSALNSVRALICGKITSMVPDIQGIGRDANAASVFAPKKIIMTYWPDESRIKTKMKKQVN